MGMYEIHAFSHVGETKISLHPLYIHNVLQEAFLRWTVLSNFCSEVMENYDLGAFSAEQEGIKVNPIELSQFIDFIKHNKLQTESFIIGPNQCEFCFSC